MTSETMAAAAADAYRAGAVGELLMCSSWSHALAAKAESCGFGRTEMSFEQRSASVMMGVVVKFGFKTCTCTTEDVYGKG